VADVVILVATCVALTATFGMTDPVGSVTVPVMVANVVCAQAGIPRRSKVPKTASILDMLTPC